MFETLTIEHAGPVATVWMNRAEVFNAFNEQLINELTRACAQLEQDVSVRVVVLGGRGPHFSVGADLNWMRRAAGASEQENLEDARRFARMLHALSTLSKPTIARVQGAALGGGTGLLGGLGNAVSGGLGNILNIGANAAAAGGGIAASIGAAIPVLGAVALVFGFFRKKVKVLDSGLRVTIDGITLQLKLLLRFKLSAFSGLRKKYVPVTALLTMQQPTP